MATRYHSYAMSKPNHECVGTVHGDWVIFSCTSCDYEVRKNRLNGEIIVKNLKLNVNHHGTMD